MPAEVPKAVIRRWVEAWNTQDLDAAEELLAPRLAGGNLAEQWVVMDALGLLQQLGAVPGPGKAAGAPRRLVLSHACCLTRRAGPRSPDP